MLTVAEAIDRLLVASCEPAPDADIQRLVDTFIAIGADVFPDVALAVRIPAGEGAPVIVRRSAQNIAGEDASRLFPSFEHERIVEIPGGDGATLHLAANDRAKVHPDEPHENFIARFVMTIGAAIHRARLQAQLMHTCRLASFGQLAAEIVHELNNPLTSIVAYSDYLHKKALRSGADSGDAERLARISQSAERIRTLSRDLLAYVRPGKTVLGEVAIHDVIDQALVFCEHVLGECRVAVERAFGDVPAVLGASGQLTQVFVNLFTNAAHAMRDRGGRLTIQTTVVPQDDRVRIHVADEGHGIAPEHLQKIFEPYFTTKPSGMGTGLGLSIVRNIVTSHGGRIRAFARPNQGTVFEVDLPAAVRPNEPAG